MADEIEYTVFVATDAGIVTLTIRSATRPKSSELWNGMVAVGDAEVAFDSILAIVPSNKLDSYSVQVRKP
jgi:hypothetical protein